MIKSFIPWLLVFIFLIIGWEAQIFAEENEETIVFLHTNDEHGNIDHFAQIAWKKRKIEENFDNVFLVGGGDIFSGNPVVDRYIASNGKKFPGKPMIKLMNKVGYDAVVIGNHDFDYGLEKLSLLKEIASFPMLLANVAVEDYQLFKTPKPYWKKITEKGTKVAFLGLIGVGRLGIPATHPENLDGLVFSPPLRAVEELSPLEDKADLVIGLSHIGFQGDKELARQTPFFDIIIGGHSHSVVEEPVKIDETLISQAGSHGRFLGKITVEINPQKGEIANWKGHLIPVEDIEGKCPKVERKIMKFEENIAATEEEVLAFLPGGLGGREKLGSLMAKALVEKFQLDFAFQNAGGVRLNYLPPVVTRGDVYRLDPFDNGVTILKMSPAEIKKLLKYSFNRYMSIDLFPGGGGYEIVVNEAGEVEKVNIWNRDGEELKEKEYYLVGLNSYIAQTYYPLSNVEKKKEKPITTTESLIRFFQEKDFLSYKQGKNAFVDVKRTGAEGTPVANSPFYFSTKNKADQPVSPGTLIAQALKEKGNTDIGFYPTRQLGSNLSLNPGVINQEILNLFFPGFRYENQIVIFSLTGKELEKIIQEEIKRTGYDVPFQFSEGFRYQIIKGEEGDRKINLFLKGKELGREETYLIALNNYEAGRWERIVGSLGNKKGLGLSEKEALLSYLKKIEDLPEGLSKKRFRTGKPQ